jgi:hypothetical protein
MPLMSDYAGVRLGGTHSVGFGQSQPGMEILPALLRERQRGGKDRVSGRCACSGDLLDFLCM